MGAANEPKSRYMTIKDWTAEYSWPPQGGLRHLIHYAQTNGFDKVIRRVGRRILLDENALLAYIDRNGR